MKRLLCLLVPAWLLGAGCAADDGSSPSGGPGGKADDLGSTVLDFTADFQELQTGALVAGETVVVRYSGERFSECKSQDGGSQVWGITGFMVVNGETTDSFGVTRLQGQEVVATDAEIVVPDANAVEFYFRINDKFGCTAFDSDFGANYRFDVEGADNNAPAMISFEDDAVPTVSGELHSGGDVVLHYAPARLDTCAASQGGNAQWGISASVQVDQGNVRNVSVGRSENGLLVAADPSVSLEPGARLFVSFDSSSVFGCHETDPADASSYEFELAP